MFGALDSYFKIDVPPFSRRASYSQEGVRLMWKFVYFPLFQEYAMFHHFVYSTSSTLLSQGEVQTCGYSQHVVCHIC